MEDRSPPRTGVKLVSYVGLYVIASAFVQWLLSSFLPAFGLNLADYLVYAQILLALAFGYLIVSALSELFYWTTKIKYGRPTGMAVRNLVRIVGLGALAASIAGGAAGGGAGVALGGFIGIVIGFASQQVLGQAVSGLFLLISRPFKAGDQVVLGGDEGVVEDVSNLFTVVRKNDGTKVLIPNNTIIGGKIYIKSGQQQ
ncbi:MAG: mechanosensitive ion channel [Candidatus Caldarchaeum sp.]